MRAARGLVRMARPGNALVAAAGVYAGALLAGATLAIEGVALRVVAGMVAAIAFAAAGNLRNDLVDVDVDRVAHPERPLVAGAVSARAASVASVALYAVAVLASAFVAWSAVLLVVGAVPLMEGYERRWKAQGLPGNLVIGALSAAPFLVGGLAARNPAGAVLAVAGLAALATVGREILKDVEDRDADAGHRRTLPHRVGAARACVVAAGFLVATVALSPVPWLRGNVLGWAYVPAVALADAAFLAAAVAGFRRARRAQRLVKLGMVLALVAIVAGRAQAVLSS